MYDTHAANLNPHAPSKPYQAVYRAHSSTIQTLSHALRILYGVPQPILYYRQHISLINPYLDLCFDNCIHHDRENQILTVSFPSELVGIVSRIRNSHKCRMVTYWKDHEEFIQEVKIDSRTEINRLGCLGGKEQTIRIYTGGVENLVVSFDVWLFKTHFRSAL